MSDKPQGRAKEIARLERKLAALKEQLRLCNVDQFSTAAELAAAQAEIAELTEELNNKRCRRIVAKQERSFEMSDTPRTNFVAHETGDAEWDRSINRFGRMMAHACILERELAAAQAEIAELTEELNGKRRFCYAVEQALGGLKGDYVEIIKELRKERMK